jgi:protein-tyrosine phosphatase
VMIHPEIEISWKNGELLSVADKGQYLLIELPHGLFFDLQDLVKNFRQLGIRPILAHPERLPEFLLEPGQIERVIDAGCLVQVSTKSVTHPSNGQEEKALKSWFKRGVVHVMGSDGHSPRRRPPKMAEAYQRIVHWAGSSSADRVFSTHGMAIYQGLPFFVPDPEPPARSWFSWFA